MAIHPINYMKSRRSLLIPVLSGLIYCGAIMTGCKKTTADTVASVTVLDSLGMPAIAAEVTLWQDTAHNPVTGAQSNVRVTSLTDGSGVAKFTFKNEAFLNIWAT